MFYLIHILLGALIATKFSSLPLIAVLCVIGHFLLDLIPHWDGFFDNKNFILMDHISVKKRDIFLQLIDLAISAIVLLYLDNHLGKIIFAGAFFSILPDILKFGYGTKLKNKSWYMRYLKFHAKIQRETGIFFGLLNQAIIAFIILKLLF